MILLVSGVRVALAAQEPSGRVCGRVTPRACATGVVGPSRGASSGTS